MTASHTAWLLYLNRVQTLINGQHDEFERGGNVAPIKLFGPTVEQVAIIQRALDATAARVTEDAIHQALKPIVNALDAIDNSGLKNATIKDCRAGIQEAYEALHVLKRGVEEKLKAGSSR